MKKSMIVLANFNQALQQEFNHSIFMLHWIYLERIPQLFDFVATNLPVKILKGFLKPVWSIKRYAKLP